MATTLGSVSVNTTIEYASGWEIDNEHYQLYHVSARSGSKRQLSRININLDGTSDSAGGTGFIQDSSDRFSDFTVLPYPENLDKSILFHSYSDSVGVADDDVFVEVYIFDHVNGPLNTNNIDIDPDFNLFVTTDNDAVYGDSGRAQMAVPINSSGARFDSGHTTVRVDRAAYVSFVYYSTTGGCNFSAIRWELDETNETLYPMMIQTTSLASRQFKRDVYGNKVSGNTAYFWLVDESGNAVEASVNTMTCAITLDASPDLDTNFDHEQARKALVPATYSLDQWADKVRPNMHEIGGSEIAVMDNPDLGLSKTIDITGTPKSEMFTAAGVDAASEEAFSGTVGTNDVWAPPLSNGWPIGHTNYRSAGKAVFVSANVSVPFYYHPYVMASEVTGPPGPDCSNGIGGAGYVIAQGSGVNAWALYDPDCNLVKSGGIGPTGLMTFQRIGRLIYIYSGGAYLGGYLIPENTWDALSIADQSYVGYYTNGDRDYTPTVSEVESITLPGDATYQMGFYLDRFSRTGDGPVLWNRWANNMRRSLDAFTDGSTYTVGTDFQQAQFDAATTVWRGGRSDQPSMNYTQALAIATAYGSVDAIEVTFS